MSLNVMDAKAAYGATSLRSGSSLPVSAPQESGFGDFLSKSLSTMTEASRKSEAVAAQTVAGQGNLVDVVTAVNNAELALETVVAVRDRMISAYQDIMRMPI